MLLIHIINHIEKEARRLATDVDALVENLSCVLQVSITTIDSKDIIPDGRFESFYFCIRYKG